MPGERKALGCEGRSRRILDRGVKTREKTTGGLPSMTGMGGWESRGDAWSGKRGRRGEGV